MNRIYRGWDGYLSASDSATITGAWDFTGGITSNALNLLTSSASLSRGDVLGTDGSNYSTTHVGSDGSLLVVNSVNTNGLGWGSNPGVLITDKVSGGVSALGAGSTQNISLTLSSNTTDNVWVNFSAYGSFSDSYVLVWKRADGKGGVFMGNSTVTFPTFPIVATPASGTINAVLKNAYVLSQNFSYLMEAVGVD